MKIEVISEEIVKASSTSLEWSEKTKLSNNDVVMPPVYTASCFFYKNHGNILPVMPGSHLKRNLSVLLSRFPEFCGRLIEGDGSSIFVDRNNAGASFVVAKGNFGLEMLETEKFAQSALPDGLIDLSSSGGFLLKAQITYLTDGSAILTTAVHHSLADGFGNFRFIQSWAKICADSNALETIEGFNGAERQTLFGSGVPPIFDHPEYVFRTGPFQVPASIPAMTAKVFHFSQENLKRLKNELMPTAYTNISRNDALCALLWRCVTQARGVDMNKITKFGMACNGRKRFSPQLPNSYIGNVNFFVFVVTDVSSLLTESLTATATRIRAAVAGVSHEWMVDALNWVEQQPKKRAIQASFNPFLTDDFAVTSWVGFPVFETDFGYGPPVSFRIPSKAFDGLAILLPSSDGGVDATIGLTVDAMEKLIVNTTLLNYIDF